MHNALLFIRAVREDDELRERIARLTPSAGLDEVVAIAAEAGFLFTAAELRAAHKHDWALRWVRYSASSASE
ncbi:MAG TPA: Nif11-like leader peptide family natural product precursor [Gemmatimonadaceae bacterium]|nr:Nif11-like leader peptide family natural product precursor [Gemmatimonadaceae bacterium]